jgi:mono/diheme cytochrome c family protein
MRWNRWAACGLVLVTLIITALSCAPASKPADQAVAAKEDPVARGKRLAWTSGCVDCHTPGSLYGVPDTTRLLSGSELGWQGPWGVSFARNLTPDSTGLATWTEDDIVKAIRTGVRPNNTQILPPMPWQDFARLTDEDANAIAAYLKTLPAVKHVMPAVVPPGQKFKGAMLVFPPPPAWDAKNLPPPGR